MSENWNFLDPSRSISSRVKDLIARLTITEKVSQMSHPAKAIPRLHIPAYNYWSEALHGVARNGRATVFPQVIGMAATWNRDLIFQVASAIGDEARAKYHEVMRRQGYSDRYQGLTFWSPNVNIFRDPRWGRGQETWGEDPYLTGEMGSAFVRGLQGDHHRYLKAAACAKHFAVHSGPEKDRHIFNAIPSLQDLFATYLPAFQKLVTEAKVEAIMGAYNRTLNEPCCASRFLLGEILRGEWGFEGHVVSDCGALSDIHKTHKATQGAIESAALALKAGCDIGCDTVYEKLLEGIQRGLVCEADIDKAIARTLLTRFKLGMFDPPEMVPYSSIPLSVVGCEEHRNLARLAAEQSIVLLKNQGSILPIGEQIKSIFITGPGAANLDVLLGNYNGLSDAYTSFLEGIIAQVPEGIKVEYRPGCQWVTPNTKEVNWAVYEAGECDLTIACMGSAPMMEGEEGEAILSDDCGDRSDINLSAVQSDYIKRLASQGAKIILVLSGGSPIALGEIEKLVQAIVFVWYPGEVGGRALAKVLFGDYSPSGKLPITFPRSINQLPPFSDYSMRQRTYRYSNAEPLFPFGFGLGYTNFRYGNLRLDNQEVRKGQEILTNLTIRNIGEAFGEEVVQVYISLLNASVPVPKYNLVNFQRVALHPGEERSLHFAITPDMMSYYDLQGKPRLENSQIKIEIGGCSPGTRGRKLGAPSPLCAEFTVY